MRNGDDVQLEGTDFGELAPDRRGLPITGSSVHSRRWKADPSRPGGNGVGH